MTSFYSSEGDMLLTEHIHDQKLISYPLFEFADDKVYPSQPCVSLSYQDLLSDNSVSAHGLSLSLGSQVPSPVQLASDLNHYTNSSFAQSEDRLSQNTMPCLKTSKYLKAAQDLLHEVVTVENALQQLDKGRNVSSLCRDASRDLSPSERRDLQSKMNILLSTLDEVDRRYKLYFHQMQVLVSSFDAVAGNGAAKPYTALALRTISCQFRRLRDGIKTEIQAAQKSLGEQDSDSPSHGALSRLHYVDQQLRQQKALQQFGITRQPWRPQRGLPESAVSVLRAWLFEHFLHPYPKDSEKLVLARQTGLTRSQVANWFINARVRLWKPMIEEMYKDLGDAENEPKSSTEHVPASRVDAFQDNEKDLQAIPCGINQPNGDESTSSSSRGLEKSEYYYLSSVNNQHIIRNSRLFF